MHGIKPSVRKMSSWPQLPTKLCFAIRSRPYGPWADDRITIIMATLHTPNQKTYYSLHWQYYGTCSFTSSFKKFQFKPAISTRNANKGSPRYIITWIHFGVTRKGDDPPLRFGVGMTTARDFSRAELPKMAESIDYSHSLPTSIL